MYGEHQAKMSAAAPLPSPGFYNGPMDATCVERDRTPAERALEELSWAVGALQERINMLDAKLRPVMQVVPEDGRVPACPPAPSSGVPLVDAIAAQSSFIRAADDRLTTIFARLGV